MRKSGKHDHALNTKQHSGIIVNFLRYIYDTGNVKPLSIEIQIDILTGEMKCTPPSSHTKKIKFER